MAGFREEFKRRFESSGAAPDGSRKRVRTEQGGTGLSKLEATLSAELGFAVLQLLPFRDAIALALTNKGMKSWVLPELHRIHAREAKEDDTLVPLALQWAVWYGKASVFEASIQAMDEIGLNSNEVVTRTLRSDCELAGLLEKRGESRLPHKTKMLRWDFTHRYHCPLRYLQLLDLACIQGHFDMVKVLADKTGDISQGPAMGFMSHVAFALNVDIVKFLLDRGASLGTNESSCAFLGLALRAAWVQRQSGSWRPHDPEQTTKDVLAVIEYLLQRGFKVSSQYTNLELHPYDQAITGGVTEVMTLFFEAASTLTLTDLGTGRQLNMVTRAMRRKEWEVASLLLDAGGVPDGQDFFEMWHSNRKPNDALMQRMMEVMPKDATVLGTPLTVCAIRREDFELLEMLIKAGFAFPDKAIHFGKGKLRRLMTFIANR